MKKIICTMKVVLTADRWGQVENMLRGDVLKW